MRNMRYLVPNAVTVAAMFCGLLAIARAADGDLIAATWWILTATVLDGIDGGVARALKAQSEFGRQLDSLSDFASFGVAPPIVLYASLRADTSELLLLAVGMAFALACAVRLARFNIAKPNVNYQGMPCPLAAGVFTLVLHLCMKYEVDLSSAAIPLALLLVAFGVAMVSSAIPYRKLGRENSPVLRAIVVVLVLTCWVFIATRQLPEFLIAVSGSAALFGPILAIVDKPRAAPAHRVED
jgi:CDP-diacylglycerol--serine O-phosphatidyltransferase